MHDLMQAFEIKPNQFETLTTTGSNPAMQHKRPFKVDVAKDKEASIEADAKGKERIKVYSDGSAQDGKVGAATVLIRPGKETRKLHLHLGSADHHTVFEAELVGLLLGLHLIKTENTRTSFAIGVDNQAVLAAAATPGNRSGHYLANAFLTAAFNLRKIRGTTKYALTLRWTAGHVKIEGNEQADEEAKKAAEGTTSDKKALPKTLRKPLKHNKSTAKQSYKEKLKRIWTREWQESPRAQKLKNIDSSLPSPKFLKLTSSPEISRQGASWLFQLRTGHFPLNACLHRVKRAETASCPACRHHKETTQHFLLDCPIYAHERWPLIAQKSPENREYANLIREGKNAILITDYIQAMGRFRQDTNRESRGAGNGAGNRGNRDAEQRTEAEGRRHIDIERRP